MEPELARAFLTDYCLPAYVLQVLHLKQKINITNLTFRSMQNCICQQKSLITLMLLYYLRSSSIEYFLQRNEKRARKDKDKTATD
jgi:hypothetical protein